MKNLDIAAAIIGAFVTYIFFIQFFSSYELRAGAFVSDWFVNPAAGCVAADALIS